MLETPHVIVGAAIASKIPNPLISLPLAFGSHFILDKVPHWNPHLNTETQKYGKVTKKSTALVVMDVGLALVSGLTIASTSLPSVSHALVILFGSFFAVLPDVVEGPYFFLNYKTNFIKKWIAFQKSIQTDTTPVPGLLIQVLTIVAAIFWIAS